ncbi:hypothetical protein CU254_41430 (plasmid) [Amycolatopsis sp. AA4]|uniref:hypothetical protein n=1 Tax=Actinomycetes TaxID=1760 RepID=UPI0001B556CA|nr:MULTISPECIES: hypothetical protein [Actinomycetes]ATY17049.1 hypothetical protein CU254_41430 [Amycolatopsis sp. AA4]EFL12454.1 predicted protein [Streptomyces sp. AA4]
MSTLQARLPSLAGFTPVVVASVWLLGRVLAGARAHAAGPRVRFVPTRPAEPVRLCDQPAAGWRWFRPRFPSRQALAAAARA